MNRILDVRLIRVVLALAAISALTLALLPAQDLPELFPHSDKVKHAAIFALLGGLARLGFPDAPAALIVERLAFFGTGIEVLQTMPIVQRDCSVFDVAADVIGVLLALPPATWLARRFS